MNGNSNDDYLSRANRAFKGKPVGEVMSRVRAIIAPSNMPSGEQETLAQQALDALRNMERPTPTQLAALELVIRLMRPVPLSKNGELEELDEDTTPEFAGWDKFRTSVKPYLYSVGRIDLLPQESIGTGFLVTDSLLVTNKHVLNQLSKGTEQLEKGQAVIRFHYEYGVPEDDNSDANIIEVVAIHPSLDIALLRVETQKFSEVRQPLSVDEKGVEAGDSIVVIGYPFKDARNPLFLNALFGDKCGVKRAALGEVMGTGGQSIYHDCSTTGGNSGSPVLSMKGAQVVGLHRDGYFLYRNEAVNGSSLSAFVQQYVK